MVRGWLVAALVLASVNVAPASSWTAEMDAMELALAQRDWQRAVQAGSKAVLEAEVIGRDSAQLAFTLNEVARMHAQVGTPQVAVKLLERLLKLMEEEVGHQHASIGPVLGSLTAVHRQMAGAAWGRHDALTAERHLGRALEHMRRREGDAHPAVAGLLRELALAAELQGHADVAAQRLAEAIVVLRRAGDSTALVLALEDLGDLKSVRGNAAEAEALMKEAVLLAAKLLGRDHGKFARLLEHLGVVLDTAGQPDRARKAFEKALARWTALLGEVHPLVAMRRAHLAQRGGAAELSR